MDRTQRLPPTTRYLIAYNTISGILWLSILGRVLLLFPFVGPNNIYYAVGNYTKWVQTLAVLEIIHVLLGLLRSNFSTTAVQVTSRLLLVWGVCDRLWAPRISTAYPIMLIAWSMTEVCRYSYYVASLTRSTSSVLTWLRYNTFWILYPLGAGSEAWCIWVGLAEAKHWSMWYYAFLIVSLSTYGPGLYNQYTHMIRQRRKNMMGKKRA